MRIGLLGYGKAGKSVANSIIESKDFNLEWIIRKQVKNLNFLKKENSNPIPIFSSETENISDILKNNPVDFIVDFSNEKSIYYYGEEAANQNVAIISAVSHYKEKDFEYLKSFSKLTKVFWSPNITLGVNFIMSAAKFLQHIYPEIDIEIIEQHFKDKKGVSGTALKIADSLNLDKSKINSIRVGGIVGKHEIIFGFPYQTVRLIHESITREAFGNGVLFVAKELKTKKNGIYSFQELLMPYFNFNI